MPQRNRNNVPHLLRAIPVKVSLEDGKISNKTTMGKKLERFGLLMRRMALDWTLSRRQRVDFGAPP